LAETAESRRNREPRRAVRDNFVRKLGSDPKQRKATGEHLLLLLDRLDDISKAELLARAFAAYVDLGFMG